MLKEQAIVKIVKLLGADNGKGSKHSPAIGDIGTIVEVIHDSNLRIRYVVKSIGQDDATIWLREFEPEELILASEYQSSEQYLTYLRVKWLHNDPIDPIFFYYEIKEDDWAIRGIEVCSDGSMQNVGHGLYEGPIPRLEEFDAMLDFEGIEISKDEFETQWNKLMEDNNRD